jgi:hypothetical protein
MLLQASGVPGGSAGQAGDDRGFGRDAVESMMPM